MLNEKRNKVESNIVRKLDLNNKYTSYHENKKIFKFSKQQRIIRDLDQIHLINTKKELIHVD